ncbi:glycosyltransferase family 2 protein [Planktotalea sp.]|uniref:glycosyltransferase family 2 protein n=1 Tax=Planktotalea sp. TaxID=2029877 RepID=UPI00329A061D
MQAAQKRNPFKISIVTAVYNREATIGEAIQSVQDQSYSNIEHVIQDGGSTDGTLGVIEQLSNSRTSLVSERDEGIYDAINLGMQRATGDVVGLMHSDDIFAQDSIIEGVAQAFEDPSIDCVYGDLQYVAADDTSRVIRHWKAGPFERAKLRRGWMPPHPTFYLRRSILERLGNYDTSFQIAADYDAMMRWLWTGQIKTAYLPQVMVKMRVGGESNRSLGRILQKSREDYRAIKANNLGGFGTLLCKNLRKVGQFRF